jgi:peptidoglycan-associated lipoprotein
MIEVAEESAEKKDYANAIEWFEKAYKESKDKDLKVVIGDLHMLLRDYKKAERAYDRALKRDKDGVYEYLRVDYAKALKYQGMYREALAELRTVASTTDDDSTRQVALFEIDGIEKMDTYAQNLEAVIEFAGKTVNSGSGENSPMRYSDGSLYYSSFNRKSEIVLDGDEEGYEAKIYTAAKDDKGEYDKPKALNKRINREGYNSAGVSFSGDNKTMYFTRAKLDVNDIEESVIFKAPRNDSGWGSAIEVENINGDYISLHPIEGELFGNKVLFFSSNMDGGFGGYDLYYSTITGDNYATPVNLGESINTPGNEVTPFYQNGTLYFSTDGRPGFGGYDIWYGTWNGASFENITNMGYNYNSAQDDQYLRFNPDGAAGFMTSNRPHKDKRKLKGSDTCCDDIYAIQLREIVIDLMVKVNDEKGPLKEATVELIDLSVADETDGMQSKTNLINNEFNFLLDADHRYRVVVSREGFYPDTTVSFNTVGLLDSYTVKKTVTLKPLPPVEVEEEGIEIVEANKPIRLNNIYYDFDKWDILPDAEDDLGYLKSLMDDYPDMVIELSSHTDSRGPSAYNKTLSQRRAQSAKNWLVADGISTERIKAVGYGESIITNQCTDGVRCSESEHRVNRRTEFKIIAGPKTIKIKTEVIRKKSSSSIGGKQAFIYEPYPIISFVKDSIHIGTLIKGETKPIEYHFTNTGDSDLIIEVVTTCKCTDLEWPKTPVKPGEKGVIKAVYDTSTQHLGENVKTIDIIANTEHLVTEVKFSSVLVENMKKTK